MDSKVLLGARLWQYKDDRSVESTKRSLAAVEAPFAPPTPNPPSYLPPFLPNTMTWGTYKDAASGWLLGLFRSKKRSLPVKLMNSADSLKPNDTIGALQNLKYSKFIFDKWAEELDRGNSQTLSDAVDNICDLRMNYAEAMVKILTDANRSDSGIIEIPESIIQTGIIIDNSSAALGARTGIMKEFLDSINDMARRIDMAIQKKEDSLWQKIKGWIQRLLSVLSTVLGACASVVTFCDPTGITAVALAAGCTLSGAIANLLKDLDQISSRKEREMEREEKLMTFLRVILPREIRQAQFNLNAGEESLKALRMLEGEVKLRTRITTEDCSSLIKVWQSHKKSLDFVKQINGLQTDNIIVN